MRSPSSFCFHAGGQQEAASSEQQQPSPTAALLQQGGTFTDDMLDLLNTWDSGGASPTVGATTAGALVGPRMRVKDEQCFFAPLPVHHTPPAPRHCSRDCLLCICTHVLALRSPDVLLTTRSVFPIPVGSSSAARGALEQQGAPTHATSSQAPPSTSAGAHSSGRVEFATSVQPAGAYN